MTQSVSIHKTGPRYYRLRKCRGSQVGIVFAILLFTKSIESTLHAIKIYIGLTFLDFSNYYTFFSQFRSHFLLEERRYVETQNKEYFQRGKFFVCCAHKQCNKILDLKYSVSGYFHTYQISFVYSVALCSLALVILFINTVNRQSYRSTVIHTALILQYCRIPIRHFFS